MTRFVLGERNEARLPGPVVSSCPQLKTQSEQITRSAAGSLPALSDCTYRRPHLYLVNPGPGARRKFQKRNSGEHYLSCFLPIIGGFILKRVCLNSEKHGWCCLVFIFSICSVILVPLANSRPAAMVSNPAPFFVETRQLSLSSCIWRKFRPERQGRPLVEAASLAYSGNSPPTSPTASQSLQHLHSHSLPV